MEEITTEKTFTTKKRNSPSNDQIIVGTHSEKPKLLSEEEIKKKEHNRKKTEKQKLKKKRKMVQTKNRFKYLHIKFTRRHNSK